jgi:hypothetical protein
VWIPNNEILKRDGVSDTAEAARTYLHAIIGDVVPPERIDTYLERGPEMLSFVLKHSPLKMCWVCPGRHGGRLVGTTVPLVGAPWFALSERNFPGSIIVNMSGDRFMNESMPYVEACHHMYGGVDGQGPGRVRTSPPGCCSTSSTTTGTSSPDCNQGNGFRACGWRTGSSWRPTRWRNSRSRPGLPAEALTATVERFNGFARSGVDEDFHRGESAYERYYGDPTNKPNPNLGEISHGPFYAAEMVPGDLGTKGDPHRCARPCFARRRVGDRRPLRRGQCQRPGDGPHLPRAWRHHRPGDDLQVFGRTAHRGSRPAGHI